MKHIFAFKPTITNRITKEDNKILLDGQEAETILSDLSTGPNDELYFKNSPILKPKIVIGTFMPTTVTNNTNFYLNIDQDSLVGDTSLISGNNFVVPKSGLYSIVTNQGRYSAGNAITLNHIGFEKNGASWHIVSSLTNSTYIPSISNLQYLNENDVLRCQVFLSFTSSLPWLIIPTFQFMCLQEFELTTT
jgi:hypothetical protein